MTAGNMADKRLKKKSMDRLREVSKAPILLALIDRFFFRFGPGIGPSLEAYESEHRSL